MTEKRQRAGRPPLCPNEKAIRLSVSFPPRVVEQLEQLADEKDWSLSQAIRNIVTTALRRAGWPE